MTAVEDLGFAIAPGETVAVGESGSGKSVISLSRSYLGVADHITLFPGIAIFVTVLALNLLGDGLRDALDPKLKT
ncbi:hypothetical protein AB4Z01_04315 [Inquilinus sp. YAF38]|uniref:hypothetical protein n=1 Tax=Inquilinus sp. YAF38 TaxID=3233084 RepID=UPI003F8EBE46